MLKDLQERLHHAESDLLTLARHVRQIDRLSLRRHSPQADRLEGKAEGIRYALSLVEESTPEE